MKMLDTMSTQAPSMTENSVIKHYKKQLIYRQNDNNNCTLNEVSNTKIYDFEEKPESEKQAEKKTRLKRKNRTCRGQYRHQGMELIKLGRPSSLRKALQIETNPTILPSPVPPLSVIKSHHGVQPPSSQPIMTKPPYQSVSHPLPQMVPNRRQSREQPPKVPLPYPPYPVPYPPYTIKFRPPPPPYPNKQPPTRQEYRPPEPKKAKLDEKIPTTAIDLTVRGEPKEMHHQCHCKCGKSYFPNETTKNVIITVSEEKSEPVMSMKGKVINGVLKLDEPPLPEKKVDTPIVPQPKMPQLFLIKDLLAKGVRLEAPPSKQDDSSKNPKPNSAPRPTIISSPEAQSYSINTILNSNNNTNNKKAKQSTDDIDTISVSSGSSCESGKSPNKNRQIPHGKLCYYSHNNSLIRYFDHTQKKLFYENLKSEQQSKERNDEKEIIELPRGAFFSSKDSLSVEEYVSEMTLVEKHIPRDFFLFYKFVTGYQICNHNIPVSFLTFLKIYNTNGLKKLLENYITTLNK